MRTARMTVTTALLAIVLMTAGCTTYYRVTEPGSGKMYYTTDVKRRGSAVEFKDAKSGSEVTLAGLRDQGDHGRRLHKEHR